MKLVVASEGMGSWSQDFFNHIAKITFGHDTEIEYKNDDSAQILLTSMFFNHERQFPKNLPYITWSGERFEAPERDYPPIYSVWKPSDPKAFKIPYFVVAFFELQRVHGLKFDLKDLRLGTFEKPYFLAYCASRPVPVRDNLFKLLKDRSATAHGLGGCQTTPGFRVDGHWHNIFETYKNYRFVLAMENSQVKEYVTEKLLNVLISGAIPIYWGYSEWVKRVFNEKCIIFVDDFESLEACADYIVKVDTTPELYQQYLDEPRFVKEMGYFDIENPCEDYLKMGEILKNDVKV